MKARFSKLVYVHFGSLSSGQANVVHVARMADALAGLIGKVTLVAFVDKGFSPPSFLAKYGRRRAYSLRTVNTRAGFLAGMLGLTFAAAASALGPSRTLIYTRSALMAAVLALLPRPIILEMHAPLSSLRPRIRRVLLAWIRLGRFRSIVVISDRLRELVEAELAAESLGRAPRIVVAHDGANASPEAPAASVADSRQLKVGYAGHLYPGRGIDLIVECARRCPALIFEVVGGAPETVAEWRGLAADVPNLSFRGSIDPAAVEAFLQSCNVLMAPYAARVYTQHGKFETSEWMSPLKVFEYMASGRAIVCSRLKVIEEVLEDGRNSLLCTPGDVDQWVEALERLAANQPLRALVGEAARSDLLKLYTWDIRAASILSASDC